MESVEKLQSHVWSTTKLEAFLLFALHLHIDIYYLKLTSSMYATVCMLCRYVISDRIIIFVTGVYVILLYFDVMQQCDWLLIYSRVYGFQGSMEVVPFARCYPQTLSGPEHH